jgi:hypothetical protein
MFQMLSVIQPGVARSFDIECTVQPCPWLEADYAAGQADFFRDLKAVWPTVLLSLYVSGGPGVRITGPPANSLAQGAYPFGYSAAQVQAFAPYIDQVVYGGYASVSPLASRTLAC